MDRARRNKKISDAIRRKTDELISGPNAKEKCIKYLAHLDIGDTDYSGVSTKDDV